jgi:hypothetical protein
MHACFFAHACHFLARSLLAEGAAASLHWNFQLEIAKCMNSPRLLRNEPSTKLLRFISDDVWGSKGVCRVISRSISAYLVQAWDVRNSCKHTGAVLPLSAAPVGRGADGVDAMA